MKKLFIETYGCQMNVADSEVVASVMKMAGYDVCEDIADADAVLLNTCSVRDNAEQKIYHRLEALDAERRKGRKLIVGVLGCMAERVRDELLENHHADLVAGPDAYLALPDLIAQAEAGHKAINIELSTTETYRDVVPQRLHASRTGGFVSIMRGCNNFCHYCIVPYTRGRERSRCPDAIEKELRELVAAGYKDITLLGQNVNSYGKDLDDQLDFSGLLRRLDAVEGDYLLRFMTSHPKDASPRLFDTMAECRHVAKQLHLPFQSGSDEILARMNRGYTAAHYCELIAYAREKMPDITLSSDIIVGFPGETEEDFQKTLSLVRGVGFDMLYTFLYSKRSGTPAATYPDSASKEEKQGRFDRLLNAQDETVAGRQAAYLGKRLRVLVDGEGKSPEYPFAARTEGGLLVCCAGDGLKTGEFAEVEIDKTTLRCLFAHKIKP